VRPPATIFIFVANLKVCPTFFISSFGKTKTIFFISETLRNFDTVNSIIFLFPINSNCFFEPNLKPFPAATIIAAIFIITTIHTDN